MEIYTIRRENKNYSFIFIKKVDYKQKGISDNVDNSYFG